MRFYGISMTDGLVSVPGPVSLPLLSMDDIVLGTVGDDRLSANVVLADAVQTLVNKTIDTADNDITVAQADVTGLTLALSLKLDAASYTPADVLAKLLTVDGSGSGLDADLLDGSSSAAFLQVATYQALAPAWSAPHTFSAGSGAVVLANTAGPILRLSDTDAAVGQKNIRVRNISGTLSITSEDDALASVTSLLAGTNSAGAWTNLAFGNTTDNTTYSFLGTGTATFSGQALGKAAIRSDSATAGIGYATGAGGAVTQATSRTTGVTLNKICGAITLVSAAGTATWQSFTVTNSAVAATDVVRVCQKSGTDKNQIHVTAVGAGSFEISFATTGGTTVEQPVFNFAVIKAVAA